MQNLIASFKKTGSCKFIMAKDKFMFTDLYFLLAKDSPYSNYFSQGYV